jgi:medium-chain acyl-[acyl-carrier-protein] hydrolase
MSIFQKEYEIASYLVNADGRLGLAHLLGLLQDAASLHAKQLGIGRPQMEEMGMFWVLTRQSLEISHWPGWHESLRVETWIRPGEGAASNRDFRIYQHQQLIAQGTSAWLALGLGHRRPVIWDRSSILGKLVHADQVPLETRKIPALTNGHTLRRLVVLPSEIDMNHHVNNTRYAQWVVDACSALTSEQLIKSYEVNFLAEARADDLLLIEGQEQGNHQLHFQGVREQDGVKIFTSRINLHNQLAQD